MSRPAIPLSAARSAPSFLSPLHRSNEKAPEMQQKGTNSSPSTLSIA
ncbi:hypothetical protein [Roseomonas genomospecies 6]|nr:hypothetical protein [Roseomonas genomospecies 6]